MVPGVESEIFSVEFHGCAILNVIFRKAVYMNGNGRAEAACGEKL
jgi:hypothetical protein